MSVKKVEYVCECGCYGMATGTRVKKGLVCYCPKGHHGLQKIARVFRKEWHLVCLEPACTYRRWYGQAKDEAMEASRRHEASTGHLGIAVVYDDVSQDGKGRLYRTKRGTERAESCAIIREASQAVMLPCPF